MNNWVPLLIYATIVVAVYVWGPAAGMSHFSGDTFNAWLLLCFASSIVLHAAKHAFYVYKFRQEINSYAGELLESPDALPGIIKRSLRNLLVTLIFGLILAFIFADTLNDIQRSPLKGMMWALLIFFGVGAAIDQLRFMLFFRRS